MEWIKIENLQHILDHFTPSSIHPDDPDYIPFWKNLKKKCIEGVWVEQSPQLCLFKPSKSSTSKYRYVPGILGFYHHFVAIRVKDKINKSHGKLARPDIRDVEWHRAYYYLEARGFSGFEDSPYSADERLTKPGPPAEPELLNSDGTFKTYKTPREILFMLHDQPCGRPLYNNQAKNHLELGCVKRDTKLTLADGNQIKAQDLTTSHDLLGIDFKPRAVLDVYKGYDYMYEIKTKNQSLITTEDHINVLFHPIIKEVTQLTTGQLLEEQYQEYCLLPSQEKIISIKPRNKELYIGLELDQDHLYFANNILTHNSRGGGKSYWYMGMILYNLVFFGLKYYDIHEEPVQNKTQQNVASAEKGKASETIDKLKEAMRTLFTDHQRGAFSKPGFPDHEPCPFWLRMEGDAKDEEGWRHRFKVKEGDTWNDKGSGAAVFQKTYSVNKTNSTEQGAGGRRDIILYEEIGLFNSFDLAWLSDDAVVTIDQDQFGSKFGIGTSGDLELITYAKKLMSNPDIYNCLAFPINNELNQQHPIYQPNEKKSSCFFLPAYMVDTHFKDANGNTDVQKAIAAFEAKEQEILTTKGAEVLNKHRLKYPIRIEDMWLSNNSELLPVKEAKEQETFLLQQDRYKTNFTPVSFFRSLDGLKYNIDITLTPYTDLSISSRHSLQAPPIIFNEPINLNVPDAYYFTHDPYVADETGESIGAFQVWSNPRYAAHGLTPGLQAVYYGKHPRGLDAFNSVCEDIVEYYHNPIRSIYYEAIRGDRFRSHFIYKKKGHLLALKPQFEKGNWIYLKHTAQTGFDVGNNIGKLDLINRLADTLKEPIEFNGVSKPFIFYIPCIFTIRQIMSYRLEGNFDAVSAMLGYPLAVGEARHNVMTNINNANPYTPFTQNYKKQFNTIA
jgi:hypothetical protein